jgi:N utilization substance protein A
MSQMQESAPTPIENMPGLTPRSCQKLATSGITTVEQLADLAPEDLENIPGIGSKTVEKIKGRLSEYYAQLPFLSGRYGTGGRRAHVLEERDEPAEEAEATEVKENSKVGTEFEVRTLLIDAKSSVRDLQKG